MHITDSTKRKGIKITLWALPVALLGYLLAQYFVLNGILHVHYSPDIPSPMISKFASKEPAEITGTFGDTAGDIFRLITTSPLYFNVNTPRLFPKATVTVTYQNPDNQPVMQLGVQQPGGGYIYKDLAIQEPILENLGAYWHAITDGDRILWIKDQNHYQKYEAVSSVYDAKIEVLEERYGSVETRSIVDQADFEEEKKRIVELRDEQLEKIDVDKYIPSFTTIDAFLENLPPLEEIAKYNFDLSRYFEMPGYEARPGRVVINPMLRGAHDMYTYIGDGEVLDIKLTVQDINRHVGADVYTVNLRNHNGALIEKYMLPDDGDTGRTGRVQPERTLEIYRDDLPFGIYHLEIELADDDLFTKHIDSAQHLLSFHKRLYLVDNAEYQDILGDRNPQPSRIITNSSYFSMTTAHDDGYQTVFVDTVPYEINETHVPVEVDNLEGVSTVNIPKNDLRLEGNGSFAFNRDQFFDPFGTYVADVSRVENIDEYNYIIANYPEPTTDGSWLQASTTVEVPTLYLDPTKDNLGQFIISLPGLPEHNRLLYVRSIDITFEKEPITIETLVQKIRNTFSP